MSAIMLERSSTVTGQFEDRLTPSGEGYKVWVANVPPIPRGLVSSIAYFYRDAEDANAGEDAGGTGFLVRFGADKKQRGPVFDLGPWLGGFYLVTCDHVVRQWPIWRMNDGDGTFVDATALSTWFRDEESDLAVLPIEPPESLMPKAYPVDRDAHPEPSPEVLRSTGLRYAEMGQDAFLIGCFVNNQGVAYNTPSARFGHLAQLPLEGIEHPYGHKIKSYLVDLAHIQGGFSGSPVFTYHSGHGRVMGSTHWLLGVCWGTFPHYEPVVFKGTDKVHSELVVERSSGMAAVTPLWRLADLLNHPQLQEQRAQARAEWQSRGGARLL